jgi:hypothetical protein
MYALVPGTQPEFEPSRNANAQDLAQFALDGYFEWAAAHLAVRGELLGGNGGIQSDLERRSAKGALNLCHRFHGRTPARPSVFEEFSSKEKHPRVPAADTGTRASPAAL